MRRWNVKDLKTDGGEVNGGNERASEGWEMGLYDNK